MNKTLKTMMAGSLFFAAVLTGCSTPTAPTTTAAPAAAGTTAQTQAGTKPPETIAATQPGKAGAALDVAGWYAANEGNWRTVENGKWSKDPKDAPTKADLEKILETACKTQSAIGWNPYFFLAIRDPAEQKAIIGEAWQGATSEGTVTILILADQIADPEHHKDKYAELYMQSPVAYFDTGMAAGLLNVTAYGMGYSTHYFCSPNGTSITPVDDHTFGFGTYPTPNYDLSRFIGGRSYKRGWGLMKSEYDVEGNVVMIGAVVIGKRDQTVDAMSSVTKYARPSNWAIWEADEKTPPLE